MSTRYDALSNGHFPCMGRTVRTHIELEWEEVEYNLTMDVYVDDGNDGALGLWYENVSDTKFSVGPLVTGQTYKLQVNCRKLSFIFHCVRVSYWFCLVIEREILSEAGEAIPSSRFSRFGVWNYHMLISDRSLIDRLLCWWEASPALATCQVTGKELSLTICQVMSSNTCLIDHCYHGVTIPTTVALVSDVLNVTLSDHAKAPQVDLRVEESGTTVTVRSWPFPSDTLKATNLRYSGSPTWTMEELLSQLGSLSATTALLISTLTLIRCSPKYIDLRRSDRECLSWTCPE